MKTSLIYLDHAAATPLDPSVLKAMTPYLADNFFNPSATYLPAINVRKDIDAARARLAYWLGAKPPEIIFTAGATEANNLAIHGVMQNYPEANILVSSIEHESILAPSANYNRTLIKVRPDGRVDLADLKRHINNQTILVSLMQANNEIGVIQPLREAAKLIQDERTRRGPGGLPIYLHTDSAQAANYLDLHVARLGVDLMSLNGGKIYGPKQTGALFVRTGVNLTAILQGGGQERNLRSGTENVAGMIGLSWALDIAQSLRAEETKRLKSLRDGFIDELTKKLPKIVINGSTSHRLPNNVHVTLAGYDNERLLMELEAANILAAAGSACSASSEEPSHVLKAIGKTNQEARSSLRLSLGRTTKEADLTTVVNKLVKLTSTP